MELKLFNMKFIWNSIYRQNNLDMEIEIYINQY